MSKKRVAVIFGGRSGEHVVSLRSAKSVLSAIDRERYSVIPVGITRKGAWLSGEDAWLALWENREPREARPVFLHADPTQPGLLIKTGSLPGEWRYESLDIAFPVLHGPFGEDGTIQGLFEMAGLPYVGSGVLASSVGMDKVAMKVLFKYYGLPVADFLSIDRGQWSARKKHWGEEVVRRFGLPCFIKPANLGSSVGVSKARSLEAVEAAVENALLYDDKVMVEKYIPGREIECSVLGDKEPVASRPGEIIPCNEFYDYNAKYIDDRSELVVPVELGVELEQEIKRYSLEAFRAIEASGLARVDFFLRSGTRDVIVNEINTIPGFTSISMYPKLWEASGVGYRDLISRLLELAEIKHQRRQALLANPPE